MDKSKIAENIRDARKDLGITQEKLAELANVNKYTIFDWEHGTIPSIANIEKVADALACSPEFLLGIDDYRHRTTAELAEQIPLSEVSIELLTDLKSECDKCGDSDPLAHDSHLTQLVVDYLTAVIIEKGGSGCNKTMLFLMRDYIDAVKIMNKYGGRKIDSYSEEHSVAKWKAESIQEKIGECLSEIVCDQLSLYANANIRLTDRERWRKHETVLHD